MVGINEVSFGSWPYESSNLIRLNLDVMHIDECISYHDYHPIFFTYFYDFDDDN